MKIDPLQYLRVKPLAAGKEQLAGLEQDRRRIESHLLRHLIAEEIITGNRVGPAILDCLESSLEGVDFDPLYPQVKAVCQIAQIILLNGTLQYGHPFAAEIQQAAQMHIAGFVNLRPAEQYRYRVKLETLTACAGKGHIGHQIQLPCIQQRQALVPLAGYHFQRPAFGIGNGPQDIQEDTAGDASIVQQNLGWVVVDPHFKHLRRGKHRLCRQQRRQQQTDEAPGDAATKGSQRQREQHVIRRGRQRGML